jgi:putative ABC transport system permease protein
MISVLGTVGGLGLGLFLGWGLVQAANRGEFPITFALPTTQLVPIAIVGALAGVLAARRPAKRAARLDVVDALALTG